jgi:hypothetical protein
MTRSISFFLVLACACTSCSSFSKASRHQRAYEKYVRNSSRNREKQRSHFRSKNPPMPTSTTPSSTMPTEPLQSTETSPQAVPTDDSH